MGSSSGQGSNYDLSFKILLIGDPGVGKTSILRRFTSNSVQQTEPSLGVNFEIKCLTVGRKTMKLTIWDIAGQDIVGPLAGKYYAGAHGIILVYDVTKRAALTNLTSIWTKKEFYSINKGCVKMLVGNKIDKYSERAVSREEGMALARVLGCSFLECSAKTGENVERCFLELAQKIMEVHPPPRTPPSPRLPTPPGSPDGDKWWWVVPTIAAVALILSRKA